jgi:hypothetical protein
MLAGRGAIGKLKRPAGVVVPLSWVGIAKDHPTQDIDMTTEQKVARRKLSLLELAQELGNVSRACQVMGCVFKC